VVQACLWRGDATYGENLPEEVRINRAVWRIKMQNTDWGNCVRARDHVKPFQEDQQRKTATVRVRGELNGSWAVDIPPGFHEAPTVLSITA
jgi:hypothetical protein